MKLTRVLACLALITAACGDDDSGGTPDARVNNNFDAAVTIDAAANTPDAAANTPDAAVSTPDAFVADAAPPDAVPFDANLTPTVNSVDYPVIARGGQLVITGINLQNATEVTIGGTSHTNLSNVSATSVTVDAVSDSTPLGMTQSLIVNTPQGNTAGFDVTVIHLQINEVEADSPGTDSAEFVELDIGFDGQVSLDGYVLAHFNGGNDNREFAIDLDGAGATTKADGILLVADSGVPAIADIALGSTDIQQGEDALVVYQFPGAVSGFPSTFSGVAATVPVIDALVYESGNDADVTSLHALITSTNKVFQLGATSNARQTTTAQRCTRASARRDVDQFKRETPTPGAANMACSGPTTLANCTIDFSSNGCPTAFPGECGALFQLHGSGGQCHTIGVPACYGTGVSLHTLAANNRVDVFLSGNLITLQTFLAPYMGTSATMTFYDIDGNEVGTPFSEATDCNVGTPAPTHSGGFSTPVRRIEIGGGNNDIWVDDFQVNIPS